jgi:excisionase family DNA binding protein
METAQNTAKPAPKLVSFVECAQALGIGTRLLRKLQANGSLKVVRIGRRTLIAATELDRLASEGA